tara:strand:+ start:2523 stop:2918 length:396 start_codon:yes stop_codon:yes gene_type:complete
LEFTRKNGVGTEEKDKEAWEMIYNKYIQVYGLNKMYKRMLEAIREKSLCELEYCITGDRFNLTKAEIQASILETMLTNRGSGVTINKTLIHLSKWIGYWLNPKNITTQEYFDLLGEYEKYNKPNSDGKKNK